MAAGLESWLCHVGVFVLQISHPQQERTTAPMPKVSVSALDQHLACREHSISIRHDHGHRHHYSHYM